MPHGMRKSRIVCVGFLCLCFAVQVESITNRLGYLLTDDASSVTPLTFSQYQTTADVWLHHTLPLTPIDKVTAFGYAPPVYRSLTAMVYYALARTPWPNQAHDLLTILLWLAAYMALYALASQWLTSGGAMACVAVAITLNLSGWEGTGTEGIIQTILMAVGLLALVRRRWIWLFSSFVLMTMNREDAALLIAVAGLLWLTDRKDRHLLWSTLGLLAIFVLYQILAVSYIGHRPRYCPLVRWHENLDGIMYVVRTLNIHTPVVAFFTTFIPLLVAAWWPQKGKPVALKAALTVATLYIAASFVIGMLRESHRNWQLMPLLVPLALWTLFPGLRLQQDLAETCPAPVAPPDVAP